MLVLLLVLLGPLGFVVGLDLLVSVDRVLVPALVLVSWFRSWS